MISMLLDDLAESPMSDKTQENQSRTGAIPRQQVQEALRLRELSRPTVLPEVTPDTGSTTGIMPIVTEAPDETAPRDTDAPKGK